jgi:reverse gyrase
LESNILLNYRKIRCEIIQNYYFCTRKQHKLLVKKKKGIEWQKILVIVESPAKAKTIEKFLGKDFHVMSSYGHIRDLKKKDFSIDIEHQFTPIYEIPADKKKVVSELKEAAKNADTVWLASDEDREGEAISWHLYEVLGLKKRIRSALFSTKLPNRPFLPQSKIHVKSIRIWWMPNKHAVCSTVSLGSNCRQCYGARSNRRCRQAGLQSVAVRLIVEREREIQNFKSEATYRIVAVFTKEENGQTYEIKAEYNKRLKTKEEALALLEKLKSSIFTVGDIVTKPVKRSPAPPFTTSTLQQEGFSQTRLFGCSNHDGGTTTLRIGKNNLYAYRSVNLSDIGTQFGKIRNQRIIWRPLCKNAAVHNQVQRCTRGARGHSPNLSQPTGYRRNGAGETSLRPYPETYDCFTNG